SLYRRQSFQSVEGRGQHCVLWHMTKPLFTKGGPGGPGRGTSRNRLSKAFVDALCKDFEENGIGAIKVARIENPTAYLNLCASVIQNPVNLEVLARPTKWAEWMPGLKNQDIARAMIAKPADAPKAPDLPALPPRAERPLPPRIEPFNASEH